MQDLFGQDFVPRLVPDVLSAANDLEVCNPTANTIFGDRLALPESLRDLSIDDARRVLSEKKFEGVVYPDHAASGVFHRCFLLVVVVDVLEQNLSGRLVQDLF